MHKLCCLESNHVSVNCQETFQLEQKLITTQSVNHWIERPWEIKELLSSSVLHLFGSPWETRKASCLDLASELVGMGLPVPWLGFLSDLMIWAQGGLLHKQSIRNYLKSNDIKLVLNNYRDRVLGLLTSDRQCLMLRRELGALSPDLQVRSLAWLIAQWHEANLWKGKTLVPGQIASLKAQAASSLDAKALSLWDSASPEFTKELTDLIRGTCEGFTHSRTIYQKHYLLALQNGQSGLHLAQYTALRQIQKARETLFSPLHWDIAHDPEARQEIEHLHVLEDEFPVGGYSSISNRGRFESLLPSQLAFWDEPIGETDLFTWKFTRDELWYYSRDENAIRKPPLEVAIILWPGLSETRIFDPEIGFQSLTVLLATLLETTSLIESHRENQALKIRWIFQEDNLNPVTETPKDQKQLQGLLKVLLGTRILQEQHSVESLCPKEIEAFLKGPKKNGDLRIIQCHADFPISVPPLPTNDYSLHLGLAGCVPRILAGGMELAPNSKYLSQRYSWITNILAAWCQSPLGSRLTEGVLIPISG